MKNIIIEKNLIKKIIITLLTVLIIGIFIIFLFVKLNSYMTNHNNQTQEESNDNEFENRFTFISKSNFNGHGADIIVDNETRIVYLYNSDFGLQPIYNSDGTFYTISK